MKCQILFSGKIRKQYFNMSSANFFPQSAKHPFLHKVGYVKSKTFEVTANYPCEICLSPYI